MALLGRHKTPRRREVRRTIAKPRAPWLEKLLRREMALALLYVLAFTVLGGMVALMGRQRLPFREGQPVTRPYNGRVEFQSIDKEATERKRQFERDESPSFYKANEEYFKKLEIQLDSLMGLVNDPVIKTAEQVPEQTRIDLKINDETLSQLRDFTVNGEAGEAWRQLVRRLVNHVAGLTILDPQAAKQELENQANRIQVKPPDDEEETKRYDSSIINATKPTDVANFPTTIDSLVRDMVVLRFKPELRTSIAAAITSGSSEKLTPTYLFDEQETERRREEAMRAVQDQLRIFNPNALLVDTNARMTEGGKADVRRYDEADLKLIRQEREDYESSLGQSNRIFRNIATIGLVFVGGLAFWIYIAAYYPRVAQNPMRGLAVVSLALICQAAAYGLTELWPEWFYATAVFPTLLAGIVLAIAYDQRLALSFGLLHALLVTMTLNLPVSFALVLLLGVAASAVQLREVRTRSKLVKVGIVTGAAMALAVILAGFIDRPLHIQDEDWRIIYDALRALSTGAFTGLLVQGILQPIERIFKVTTGMTLKDLSDVSHPLLRRLAERAPGTWRHSLALADMAESAANAIGGDGLLCRVGAMYHDIGKINKPMYFVENQAGGPNRHDKLSPAMSVLIIVGHVKDGVEMAREFHLPPVIRHFIESHHGTTLVEYFYHAAKKQKEADPGAPGVSEFEFRYPGPKPQTKEAAIIMLCDGVEGAARTMPDPMPARLEQLVHHMAMKRLMDGQFNQCHLTLEDLHRIEEAVTKALCAMYHGRIAYPSDERRDETTPQTPLPEPAIAS